MDEDRREAGSFKLERGLLARSMVVPSRPERPVPCRNTQHQADSLAEYYQHRDPECLQARGKPARARVCRCLAVARASRCSLWLTHFARDLLGCRTLPNRLSSRKLTV